MTFDLPQAVLLTLATALFNGAITWGVVSTKLAWLRADVDQVKEDVAALRLEWERIR